MDHRSLTVDLRKDVPGLHPGLNDLIRVLGKQAHCASRTLIVCEPVCPRPAYSESKYHKNCGAPKKGKSWDSLCRPSSLWSPVRPETYYYDCFFYRKYPDRDSEYQEIEEKYNAIKQQKLDYSPPECDQDKIKAVISGASLNRSGGAKYNTLGDSSKSSKFSGVSLNRSGGAKYNTLGDSSKSSTGLGGRRGKKGGISDDLSDPGTYKNKVKLGESSMGSARNLKYPVGSGSNRNMATDGDYVPCAELAEIRDILQKSDRETIRRMQEMLTLMKELSMRDICRATCDGSPPGGRSKVGGTKSTKSKDDLYVAQEPKTRSEEEIDPGKRKGDIYDYGLQNKKKRYKQGGDSTRESDGYDPQDMKRGYQQRDEAYGPEDTVTSYQQRDSGYGPRESKKSYQKGGESLKRKIGEYDDGVDDVEPQGPKASFQKQKSSKKKNRRADDGVRESTEQRGPSKKRNRNIDVGGAELDEEYEEDYAGSQPYLDMNLNLEEPRSLQRNVDSNRSRGKLGDTDKSLSSSSSDRSRTSVKGDRPSSRKGAGENRSAVSVSDADLTASSSTYSESSTAGESRSGTGGESAFESSGTDDSEAPGKTSSSRSMLKRHQDSSQASLSVQGSKTSLGEPPSGDRSRPGSQQEQKSDKQSRLPGSAGAGRPDRPANYKIPVGENNNSLTVSQASLSVEGSNTSLGKPPSGDRSRPRSQQEQNSDKQSTLPGSASAGRPDRPANYKIPVGENNNSLTVSQASLSVEGSNTSLGEPPSGNRSRPGSQQEQKSDKQSRLPGSAGAGGPDRPANYKIPVGEKNNSLTVSQASLSVQGSKTSQGKPPSGDRSRPGSQQEQKSGEQSRLPGSAGAGGPDRPANYKIPVGKKNNSLTVHEVVELSNRITDVLMLEVINELIKRGLYLPPSERHAEEPSSLPSSSVERVPMKQSSSRRQVNEQRAFDGPREPSGYKEKSKEGLMNSMGSPTRLSRISESPSRTAELNNGSSRKDGSTRDIRKGEQRGSDESRRSNGPRHSKSLSPSNSSRCGATSCRLQIARRARSEGDPYTDTSRTPREVVLPIPPLKPSTCRLEIERKARSKGDPYSDTSRTSGEIVPPILPPKPWERRLSSQMKADSMRDSSKVDSRGRPDIPGSRGASVGGQISKTDSYKPYSTQPDQGLLRDGSVSSRQPTLQRSPQELVESSPRSTRQYEAAPQDRSDMRSSRGASIGSKTGSYRAPSTRDQASLRDSSVSSRQPTLQRSRQELAESSPRSTRQYEAAPQDRSDMPSSRGASIGSKTGSYRAPSTRDQASLRDSSVSSRQPTLQRSRQELAESSPRSSRQYEAATQDTSDMPGSRGASLGGKTGSYKALNDQAVLREGSISSRQPTLEGSRQNIPSSNPRSTTQYDMDKSSMPGSRRTSLSSRMSKQSDRNRPSHGAGKSDDSRPPDAQKDSSLSRTRIEEPYGPGKVPSGPRINKESSRGILKDRSSPDKSLGRGKEPSLRAIPTERSQEDVYGAGHVPSASRIPSATDQPDKISSSQRIIDKDVNNQPMRVAEGETSKGRLVQISEPGPQNSPEPCEPDEFIATNYDTDDSILYYARTSKNAFPPVKETYQAAGFMLRSAYNYDIPPRSKMSVKTDLLLQLPRNSYGRIAPRKCLVENYGIDVGAEVIDRDYKGNITVVLFNHGDKSFTVERGNKVAQLICESIHLAKVVENNNLLK